MAYTMQVVPKKVRVLPLWLSKSRKRLGKRPFGQYARLVTAGVCIHQTRLLTSLDISRMDIQHLSDDYLSRVNKTDGRFARGMDA